MDFNDRRPQTPNPDELAGHVNSARKSISALGRLNHGTTAGLNAAIRHSNTIDRAHEALAIAGRHDLVGSLVEEQKVTQRLKEARQKGQERPELQARLKSVRSSFRV